MQLTQIEFGSLLSYCPRGDSQQIQHSREVRTALKTDGFVSDPLDEDLQIPMSEWVTQTMSRLRSDLPFTSYFNGNAILVPTPSSSLMQRDSLWVPERIAIALVGRGFGLKVVSCLRRTRAVRKAAFSQAEERPRPSEHYETMEVQGSLSPPEEIVLIDDIVTRGATLLGLQIDCMMFFPPRA